MFEKQLKTYSLPCPHVNATHLPTINPQNIPNTPLIFLACLFPFVPFNHDSSRRSLGTTQPNPPPPPPAARRVFQIPTCIL